MKPRILICSNQKRENYIKAIEACEAEAIFSNPFLQEADCDGLLLCGGNDVHPSFYGQEISGAHSFDYERDVAEIAVTKAFLDTGKPIFGICRGMQLLNIVLGGTLIQDIKRANEHTSIGGVDNVHKVTSFGLLQKLYGKEFSVNSSHHQAINTLGKGLIANSRDKDIIEGVEHENGRVFGVQFHPERMCLDNARLDTVDGIALFDHFVNLCRKKSV